MKPADIIVYRRGPVIVIAGQALAPTNYWIVNPHIACIPADADDQVLGTAIHETLHSTATLEGTDGSPQEDWDVAEKTLHKLAGARGVRDFAKDNQAINITYEPDLRRVIVTPLVTYADGDFGAYGGEVEAPPNVDPLTLARMCREGWERGGVPDPAEGLPSHT